jgi:hypothetical protein
VNEFDFYEIIPSVSVETDEMSSTRLRELFESFLVSIEKVIPEVKESCFLVRNRIDEDFGKFVKDTVALLGENDEKIVGRDETVISNELLPGLSITPYWKELSGKSKDAVWKYLNLILLAGAKYVRSHQNHRDRDRDSGREEDVATGTKDTDEGDDKEAGLDTEAMAEEIARRLRDPELREKMIGAIQKTMAELPSGEDSTGLDDLDGDEDGPDIMGGLTSLLQGLNQTGGDSSAPGLNMEAMEGLMEGIRTTKIGKIVEEIAKDLSGELRPEMLGLPKGDDIKDVKPADLMKVFGNPDVMGKVMKLIGKIGDNINRRVESGEIRREELAAEGQEIMSKSQDLLKSISPQAASLLSALQGKAGAGAGMGGGLSTRDLMRRVDKVDVSKVLTGGRHGGVKERLQKKLEERKSATTPASTPAPTSATETTKKGGEDAKKSGGKKKTKKNP